MKKVKNEKLFVKIYKETSLNDELFEPSDLGRLQFYEHQSFGKIPEEPDSYYSILVSGKNSFDFLTKEYLDLYRTSYFNLYKIGILSLYELKNLIPKNDFEKVNITLKNGKKMYEEIEDQWWGLYSLWLDWEGKRWILPYLLNWWKKETGYNLPLWIKKEKIQEEQSHYFNKKNQKKSLISKNNCGRLIY